jgi:hypothetical protein
MVETVGIFYEKPDGTIVRTYGFSHDDVLFYSYKGEEEKINQNETIDWKPRNDLKEFPNCDHRDKRLPYSFDLFFDIKTYGQLIDEIEKINYLTEIMKNAKIKVENGKVIENG